MNGRKKLPSEIRCACGRFAKAMFTATSPRVVRDLYHCCNGCGDITEGTSGKVVGGGATKKELEDLILAKV